MITVTFYGSLTQQFAWLNFYLEVLASLRWVIYFSWNQSWMAMSLRHQKLRICSSEVREWAFFISLMNKFVINFLKGVVSICQSFRSTGQPGRINGFDRCPQVIDLCTARRHKVTPVLAKTQILKFYQPLVGNKSPSRELLSPVWGLLSPFGGLLSPFWGLQSPLGE